MLEKEGPLRHDALESGERTISQIKEIEGTRFNGEEEVFIGLIGMEAIGDVNRLKGSGEKLEDHLTFQRGRRGITSATGKFVS